MYMIVGDPEARWRECRIVDISPAGAGLKLAEAAPGEAEGKEIVVAIQLKAEVRYTEEEDDEIRVGTQFVDLSDSEHEYLTSLQELNARW